MPSWPYVNQPTSDLEYSKLMRILQRTGVQGVVGDSTLKLSANGSGMTTYIAPGSAFVRGFEYEESAIMSVDHDPATSNPRIDRVVLRLDFNQTLDSRVRPVVLKGESASNPTAAALTQIENGIWEMPIGRVTIGASVSVLQNSATVDERIFIGQQVGQWTTSTRPVSPPKYTLGFNETLGVWEYFDSSWKKIWAGVTWGDIASKPSGSTLDGRTITVSDTAPTSGDGNNGDIWLEY